MGNLAQKQGAAKSGRPSKYKAEYTKIAQKMCELGATVPDLAFAFGVAESSVKLWAVKHKTFSDALRIGRDPADDKVERAVYERAVGYSHPDIDIRVVDGCIVETPITKHYPPDMKAAWGWLFNRRSDKWHPNPESTTPPQDIKIEIINPYANKPD